MNKRVLMGLVLLIAVGTSAVFAQQPTLDKLTFTTVNTTAYSVKAANDRISGIVVIPATYNNRSVAEIENRAFQDCSAITSDTIPASVATIGNSAFETCANLTSVTFQGTATKITEAEMNFPYPSFKGDLAVKYKAGGAGTYTRSAGGTAWTKQGGAGQNTPAQIVQSQGKYYLEIYNVTPATINALDEMYRNKDPNNIAKPGNYGEDYYFLVRTANGTTLRSKDTNLTIEQVRQKLVDIGPRVTNYVSSIDERMPLAQQYWGWNGWGSNTTGSPQFRIYYWINRLE
jgi:hypothetical protein